MKFIRLLLASLFWLVVVVAVLAILAYTPVVQTWAAQLAFAHQSRVKGSVESVALGFTKVEFGNLRLEFADGTLTLPSVEVDMPVVSAAWNRKARIRSLIAKNWTLDLSHPPKPGAGETPAAPPLEGAPAGTASSAGEAPAQTAARTFRDLLTGGKLPDAGTLDGVDLEGDVLFSGGPGKPPIRSHVVLKGGNLAAGRMGDFSFDTAVGFVNPALEVVVVEAHGRLQVTAEPSRVISRVELKADLSAKGGSLPDGLAGLIDAAAVRTPSGESYTVDLIRDARHPVTIEAHFPDETRRMEGTWKVDLRDSDLASFFMDHPLPSISAAGEGRFDTDAAWERLHVLGRLQGVVGRLGVWAAPLERLGSLNLDARFDCTQQGASIQADHLSVAVAGDRPIAILESLQPFTLDEKTGALKLSDAHGDWVEGSFPGLPVAWLSSVANGFTFAGGDAKGAFLVRAVDGGFALRPKTPLTAAGVSVQKGGRVLARGLDLSLSLLANGTAQTWEAQSVPLSIASGGHPLATLTAKVSGFADASQPIAIAGSWSADLAAAAASSAIPDAGRILGRSASGDFSGTLGAMPKADGKLTVIGRDPQRSVAMSAHADVDANGRVEFKAPIKISVGSASSEVTAEGTWAAEGERGRTEVTLTGEKISLEHLSMLAAPLAAAGSAPRAAAGPDRIPFWGNWVGHVSIGFDRLRAYGHDFSDVGGVFDLDHGSIRLKGAQAELPSHAKVDLDGEIAFDGAAAYPYSLKAAAGVDRIDLARVIGAPRSGQDPMIEGRFSIASTIVGRGASLGDLLGRAQEEFRFKSTSGIIRFLRTDIADAIPQASTPVSDTLGSVGSAVGSFLGRRNSSPDSGKNPVSKTAQAVIDFTNQTAEFGCDLISFTAIRESDRTIRLSDIVMSAPDERLTGSGQLAYAKDLPLSGQPLTLDLQLSLHGLPAQLLSTVGLLGPEKDKSDFSALNQPIHLQGTLNAIDASQWHDVLAKAAVPPKPPGSKKGN